MHANGQFERAITEFNRAIALAGRSVNYVGVLGYAYGLSGNHDRARDHLEELTARAAHAYVPAMWSALVYLGLSDLEGVFTCLDRAFEERDGSLILIAAALEFDPVRDDDRFSRFSEEWSLDIWCRDETTEASRLRTISSGPHPI